MNKFYQFFGLKIQGYENLDIRTSNHVYEILSFYALSDKFQKLAEKEFDYLADKDPDGEGIEDTSGYFIYRKQLYNLSDFMRASGTVYKFGKNRKFRVDGCTGDSYFSSTIVEIQQSEDCLKVARIYS
jgi:hypothetical protein